MAEVGCMKRDKELAKSRDALSEIDGLRREGEERINDLMDRLVAAWHNDDTTDASIWEYLGMSEADYNAWASG